MQVDGDWDPEKHDAVMAELYGDDYYDAEDGNFKRREKLQAGDDDCYAPESEYGAEEAGQSRDKVLNEALEELYALEYEDIVGGVPCRFKYTEVRRLSLLVWAMTMYLLNLFKIR